MLRYNGDGYGDCEKAVFNDCSADGEPWATSNQGTGHPWPVLSGENGEYQILARQAGPAASDLGFMLASASGVGLVPEQIWNYPDVPASPYGSDPSTASIGFTDGQPDGSAAPLTWAQAQLLRLVADLASGRLAEQPSIVADRYLGGGTGSARLGGADSAERGRAADRERRRRADEPDQAVGHRRRRVGAGIRDHGAGRDCRHRPDRNRTGRRDPGHLDHDRHRGFLRSVLGEPEPAAGLELGRGRLDRPAQARVRARVAPDGATNEAIFTVTDLHVPGTVVLNAAPRLQAAAPGLAPTPTRPRPTPTARRPSRRTPSG